MSTIMTDGLHIPSTTTAAHHSSTPEADVGVSDLLFLEPLTEQSFIDNLRRRFHADKIYTAMGTLLLSINPFRPLPSLYDEQTLRLYKNQRVTDLPPHIFGAATAAYRDLIDHGTDQVLILSGESGAGKTEIAKLIIDVITSMRILSREGEQVGARLTLSDLVLRAFGNAKTASNENASRFGKYVDIALNSHGEVVGANLTTYQLDRSRVVIQGPSERNFHIFYQLLAGADAILLKSLKLQRNVEKYTLLRCGGAYRCEGIDEKREFMTTRDAMDGLNFSATECHLVFQVLAVVLKLGNLQFLPQTNVDGTESCTVLNDHEIDEVCELLEYPDPTRFHVVLTNGIIPEKNEPTENALSAAEASWLRDQLCKALYNRLFTWIVSRLNRCLSYSSSNSRSFLGVLDLYGFERFEQNGFEQFLINYTAEKLHVVTYNMIMSYEQEEYIREGLSWTRVGHASSPEVCDVMEKNHGLLFALDEASQYPSSSPLPEKVDERLIEQLCSTNLGTEAITLPKKTSTNNVPMDRFTIKHFAGDVTYSVTGFVEKNIDGVNRALAELMFSCRHALVKELFPDGNPARTNTKRPATLANHLKVALTSLISNISTKNAVQFKCIKPNDRKQAGYFDEAKIKQQVKYMGLLDQAEVRRAGFAFRQSYENFLKHYKMLSHLTWPTWDADAKEGVRLLLMSLELKPIEYAFGRTKIFIKFSETVCRLDDLRRMKLDEIATTIQKTFRAFRARKSASTSQSAQSSSQSSKESGRPPERMSKLLLRSLYNDQHSSISSSMDSSHSAPYAPYCNNVIYQPPTTSTASPPVTDSPSVSQPRDAAVSAVTVASVTRSVASPPIFRPQVPPKPRCVSVMSQSHSNIPTLQRPLPTPPIRRAMTMSNCVDRALDQDEAARKITEFFKNYIRYKFLSYLVRHLPSMSPIDQRWPASPSWLLQANMLLKQVHHRWRCWHFRKRFDQISISRMREKVAASSIFLGKKITYAKTVPHPFRGDYVRLRQNVKWKKLSSDTNDQYVVFADIMPKINRASGRPSYVLAVVSTKAFLVIDQRTMIIKYRIQANDIARISVSPYQDDIVVVHLKPGELFKRKGDFMFQSAHVIEMVTKLCLVVQNTTGKPPEVVIAAEFPVHFGSHVVLVHFKADSQGPLEFLSDVTPPGSVKISRRTNRMEVSMNPSEKSST
ncbi:hypothetical protein RvY_01532 [Ramazzottius varieornatus]|uniref:Myosin motor domain-containing protein n=1 Tax=Ramazzottius varieornatus TaxID=947166 RepID=A0A1D1UGM5_RAMVA|nr:hypothetical protein RvY_01532 [Ramazzottius varieornatus]